MSTDPQPLLRGLADELVLPVLALLLDAQSRLPDPATAEDTRRRLAAAAADATPLQLVDDDATSQFAATSPAGPTDPADRAAVSGRDLARTALTYLVCTDADAARLLPRAIQLAAADTDNPAARVEPITLAVGGLVLAVLQTEVAWTRTDTGRWRLRVHKRALRDSTVATLIRGLLQPNGAPSPTADSDRPAAR